MKLLFEKFSKLFPFNRFHDDDALHGSRFRSFSFVARTTAQRICRDSERLQVNLKCFSGNVKRRPFESIFGKRESYLRWLIASLQKLRFIESNRKLFDRTRASSLWPTWPRADLVEECVSGASGGNVLTMTQKSVSGGETSPVTGADDEGLSIVHGRSGWQDCGVSSQEAETNRAGVESWRVGTLTVPSTTFVDHSGVTNAEVVSDISPSVAVHVEVLDVSHLSVASGLGGASCSSGVMDNESIWRLSGQVCSASSTSTPSGTSTNACTWTSLSVSSDGQGGDN